MKISEYIIRYIMDYSGYYKNKFLFNGNKIGAHRGVGWGFSTEFSEYRPYIDGEDIRFLDWKHYALSGKKYIKVFTRETNANVYILVDISSSMSFYKNNDGVYLVSLLTAVISYIFYRLGDRVNLYFFNNDIVRAFNIKGDFSRLKELWDMLDTLNFSGNTDIGEVIKKIVPSFQSRGYVILISDFYTDIESLEYNINYFLPSNFYSISMFVHDDEDVDVGNGNVKVIGLEGDSIEVDGWEYKNAATDIKRRREKRIVSLLESKGMKIYKVSKNTEFKEFFYYMLSDIV